LPRPLRYTQAEHDMASMRPLRAPCVPSLCAHFRSLLCVPALRTPVCPYCVHGVLVQFVVDMCMLEPMPAARAVCARAVHPPAGRVVHLCSVRPDRATSARQRRRHRGALIYIVWSSPTLHPRRPWRLAMTFTLSPFSVTYACSCHALFLPLCPISCLCCPFFLFHILLHTLFCSLPAAVPPKGGTGLVVRS